MWSQHWVEILVLTCPVTGLISLLNLGFHICNTVTVVPHLWSVLEGGVNIYIFDPGTIRGLGVPPMHRGKLCNLESAFCTHGPFTSALTDRRSYNTMVFTTEKISVSGPTQFKGQLYVYTPTHYIYETTWFRAQHSARHAVRSQQMVLLFPEPSLFSHAQILPNTSLPPHTQLLCPGPGFCQVAAEHPYSDVLQMAQALVQTELFASPAIRALHILSISVKASPSIRCDFLYCLLLWLPASWQSSLWLISAVCPCLIVLLQFRLSSSLTWIITWMLLFLSHILVRPEWPS